jgi:hypothetical protein
MLVAEKEKQEQDVGISHEAEKTMFDAHVRDTELPLHQYLEIFHYCYVQCMGKTVAIRS